MKKLHLRVGLAIAAMFSVGIAPIAWAETIVSNTLHLRDFNRSATTLKELL